MFRDNSEVAIPGRKDSGWCLWTSSSMQYLISSFHHSVAIQSGVLFKYRHPHRLRRPYPKRQLLPNRISPNSALSQRNSGHLLTQLGKRAGMLGVLGSRELNSQWLRSVFPQRYSHIIFSKSPYRSEPCLPLL